MGLGKLLLMPGSLEDGLRAKGCAYAQKFFTNPWNNLRSPADKQKLEQACKQCALYPCSPRDPQESSPTPHFKNINSSALSFLYSPT